MSPAAAFAVAARLSTATTVAMFGLIVLGSVVRTTGSGLACPDWPLCQGRLIPPLEPHVLVEWLHRTVALIVSLLLVATAGWTLARRELRARMGGLATLAVLLLGVQVTLGALTVWTRKAVLPTTAHVVVGAGLLATTFLLALRASRLAPAAQRASAPVLARREIAA